MAKKDGGIYLFETKTKGDINEQQLIRQLNCDLQTMLYLVALKEYVARGENDSIVLQPIRGVRYNVIRRPLAGGKHSIRKREGRQTKQGLVGVETDAEFYARLSEEISGAIEPNGDHFFFMRWKVEITESDIERFKRECLDPILEQMCDWYLAVTNQPADCVGAFSRNHIHFRLPFGIYNPLLEGRSSEVDEYLASGSTVGLCHVDNIFPELQDG